ncbi:MAG: hypothetical protein O3C27_06820 [Actinomycetota bacterium]|nr:hypothetical protein [Actinomycetota bacterium]
MTSRRGHFGRIKGGTRDTGYLGREDRPVVTLTEDQIGSAVFHRPSELISSFVEIST